MSRKSCPSIEPRGMLSVTILVTGSQKPNPVPNVNNTSIIVLVPYGRMASVTIDRASAVRYSESTALKYGIYVRERVL